MMPVDESTSRALTGASGSPVNPLPVQSVQAVPALVVFHTCEVWKPMMPTYAVCPLATEVSMATEEIAYVFGLMLPVTFVITGVAAPALVVTQTSPPPMFANGP